MFLVVDSLSRSGTTLLISALGNEKKIIGVRGGFHEQLHGHSIFQNWPDRQIYSQFIKNLKVVPSKTILQKLKYEFFKNDTLCIEADALLSFGLERFLKRNQFFKLKQQDLSNLILKFKGEINSVADLDMFYENILSISGCDMLAQRWNNAIAYAPAWVARDNHYWLNIIRNPMHSAISRKKAFNTNYFKSLNYEVSYAIKRRKLKQNIKFLQIYYEDLVLAPELCLKKISEWVGLDIKIGLSNLKGTDGKALRSETSNILAKRKEGVKMDFLSTDPLVEYNSSMVLQRLTKQFKKKVISL